MKTIVLVLSLTALTAPSYAAHKHDDVWLAKQCRQIVGPEEPEAQTGKVIWANSMCNASATA